MPPMNRVSIKQTTANPTTSTTLPPPVKAELHSTTTPMPQPPNPPPSNMTRPLKKEPQDLPIPANPPPPTFPNHQHHPNFTDKVIELRDLSASLTSFLRRYDELQAHLDFIRSKLPQQNLNTPAVPLTETLASAVSAKLTNSEKTGDISNRVVSPVVPVTETLASTAVELPNSEQTKDNVQLCLSEIESLCVSMSSRGFYNYVVSHIAEVAKLREEAPGALKLAQNPVKLVLECLGYGKDSTRVEERQGSVLLLEFLLLMGGNCGEIEGKVKGEAEKVAVEWRNRVFKEGGGVKMGCEIDARGLLLFIGCFGVPSGFKNEDLRDLILACNAKEISESLRRSDVLVARIPEMVEEMIKQQMVVEAVDFAYTFGLESRYHPRLRLQQFLQESKDTWKEERKVALPAEAAKEANKKHLADLKSVLKCLEDHKLDPLIPGWRLPNLISSLQKDITHLDKIIEEKATRKREVDEPESSKNLTSQEVKRARINYNAYVDGKSSSEGLTPTNLLNGGIRGHNTSFSASSSGLHVPPTGPYPGPTFHGGMPVDSVGQVINGSGKPWHGDAPLRERLSSHSYAGPASSMGGHMGGMLVDNVGRVSNNSYMQPNGWHGDVPLSERGIGHGYPAPLGVNGGFRVSPSMEGFVGFLNPSSTDSSNRRPDSGLYGFADSVL